jgi:ferredoxin-type protein NapH
VCPINPIADAAHWLRQRLGLVGTLTINRNTRIWVMGGALLASAAGGIVAWELVNPITLLSRALVFGAAAAGTLTWGILLAVFLFDLVIASRGWCGHVCPVGAFYGLVGSVSLLKVSAQRRAACDDCLDCYKVCPEPHVIAPALKGAERGLGPVVLSRDCTNCGRCIDVCPKDVFAFDHRFNNPTYATGG